MKVANETIVRTVVLLCALLNQALIVAGHSVLPFDDEQVGEFVSTVITAAAAIWAWWKNNSFTQAALKADEYLQLERANEAK